MILGESKALDEHLRQEVDHGVDADKLLEEHDTDRGDERRTCDAEQFTHTAFGVLRCDFFDFVEFELHLVWSTSLRISVSTLKALRSSPLLTR